MRRCPQLLMAALAAAATLVAFGAAAATTDSEPQLADIRRLTTGGESAEAYWSADGSRLIFQRTGPEGGCDQIYLLDLLDGAQPVRVSSGAGRTTCGYFFPDGGFLYSTTGFASPDCPPPPDRSQGYVWPLYPYEIVAHEAGAEGEPRRLTDNDAYDAEATVCPLDGSIVFTSDRDGDLELYRMRSDGSEVVRLTDAPGYDGGAFFSPDCSQIVWRASRPRGAELERYQRLLEVGLVEPGPLELWVADADGTNARQITYFGASSFAPSFFPSGDRIVFSSNLAEPGSHQFDLWAIDVAGTRLERVTDHPDFDGFPMFSPDGLRLAFATNRFPGRPRETELAVARWVGAPPRYQERGSDRFLADVRWLADEAREGRGVGTAGLAAAADWLEGRFRELGLAPGFGDGYRQRLSIPVAVRAEPGTRLAVEGGELALGEHYEITGFSGVGSAAGEVVPVGYGIVAPELGHDDYAGIDVAGKIVLARRFVPPGEAFADPAEARRHGDLRAKAFAARERGAIALLVTDLPDGEEVEEAPLPTLRVERRSDAGIPVLALRREVARAVLAGGQRAELTVELAWEEAPADNVVALLPADAAIRRPGALVLGAHYDHLGFGGASSLAPESGEVHHGADDNASGVAALLEAARLLAANPRERDIWLVAFTGEETGLVGSTELVRQPPAALVLAEAVAMINFDMVGRLRENRLSILGGDSATEWRELLPPLCVELGLECATGGDGYGPSDHTPFYAAGLPVLHLFTGAHSDYHKPSDVAATINAAGGARIAELAARLTATLASRDGGLTYQRVATPPPTDSDLRSYGASLGTIPDYGGPPEEVSGMLIAGIRPGGPAEQAGIERGDLLVELAGTPIRDVHDLMFVLRRARPGQTSSAVVVRAGERLTLTVTFDEARRR
jgi:Tol biopolymer transport system component